MQLFKVLVSCLRSTPTSFHPGCIPATHIDISMHIDNVYRLYQITLSLHHHISSSKLKPLDQLSVFIREPFANLKKLLALCLPIIALPLIFLRHS